jgi:hypothetical protein
VRCYIKYAAILLCFLLSWGITSGQSITLPSSVTVPQPGLVVIKASAIDADDVRWFNLSPGLQAFPADVTKPALGTYVGLALKEGTYKLGVICAKSVANKAIISDPQEITVTVGTPAPPPPPPPPGPPVPPVPTPDPFGSRQEGHVRVLMIYDGVNLANTPRGQLDVLYSTDLRQWGRTHCVTLENGKDASFMIFDKDTDMSKTSPIWANVMKRPHPTLPWIVIGNGTSGFEGPLPPDVPSTLALLQKYGGK